MKTALYSHDLAIAPRQLLVLKTNDDGTVNLGKPVEGGKPLLVVSSCPVSAERKAGHCVLEAEAPVVPEGDPKK